MLIRSLRGEVGGWVGGWVGAWRYLDGLAQQMCQLRANKRLVLSGGQHQIDGATLCIIVRVNLVKKQQGLSGPRAVCPYTYAVQQIGAAAGKDG